MTTKLRGSEMPLALMLLAVSAAAVWSSSSLEMGTFNRMGPGFIPMALAVLLGILALMILVQAFITKHDVVRYAPKPLFVILGSLAFMAVMLERIGLIPCVIVVTITASLAQGKVDWGKVATLAVFLAAFCYTLFIWALGLPIPAFFG